MVIAAHIKKATPHDNRQTLHQAQNRRQTLSYDKSVSISREDLYWSCVKLPISCESIRALSFPSPPWTSSNVPSAALSESLPASPLRMSPPVPPMSVSLPACPFN